MLVVFILKRFLLKPTSLVIVSGSLIPAVSQHIDPAEVSELIHAVSFRVL